MPEDESTSSTWARLGRDLVRPTRQQLVVALVLVLCGFALTWQLAGTRDQRYSTLRQDELVAMLDDVTAEGRRLEAEIADLEATRSRLQSGADAEGEARAEASRRLDALELLGGTVPAAGQGIRVTIDDHQGRLSSEVLLNAIEELRDAGAEVIEVDDRVRLVANSWVERRDGALVVDGTRLGRRFTLEAIGDAATLSEATRFRGGLVASIEGERVGGTASVQSLTRVEIGSTVSPAPLRFARPS